MGTGRYTNISQYLSILSSPPLQNKPINILLFAYYTERGVKVHSKWLPPLSDPALWRDFIDNSSDTTGHLSGRAVRDEWHVNELRGDKIMASVAIDLFQKYSVPHTWCDNLIRALLCNDHQREISIAQELPDHLISGPIGKKGPASALEVTLFLTTCAEFDGILCSA